MNRLFTYFIVGSMVLGVAGRWGGDQGLSAQQGHLLLSVLEETNRLSSISKTLLLLSRADAGKLVVEKQPVDIALLIETILDDLEILGAQRELRIEKQVPEKLVISGNEQFLQQLALNLVDNAVKYSDTGGTVRVKVRADGDRCVISVANTGPGISPEDVPRIFERFHRGDPSRNRESGGHGLGLAISREIARAHSGDITLHLDQPGWTEFRVDLPIAEPGSSL